MKPNEDYETRLKMATMHDEMIKKLEHALKQKSYVEVSWLCYAIFEQRINRVIIKYINNCPKNLKNNKKPVSINTRIRCIRKLIKEEYLGLNILDDKLFEQINLWCNKRNQLVHGLLDLNIYKKYDEEFKKLAIEGNELVEKIYKNITNYRNWWYEEDNIKCKFPTSISNKCRCKNKCIKS